MGCPYCDHHNIWYGENRFIHTYRMFFGTRKRYCPKCQRKWRVRVHKNFKPLTLRDLLLLVVFVGVGFVIFYYVSGWIGTDYKPDVDKRKRMSTASELMKQVEGRVGLPNGTLGGTGASHEALAQRAKRMISEGTIDPSKLSGKDRERLLRKVKQYT